MRTTVKLCKPLDAGASELADPKMDKADPFQGLLHSEWAVA